MSFFERSFIAVSLALLVNACAAEPALLAQPGGIELVMQDAPAQGSASAAHAGVRIRGLDNGVALFVSSGEVRAAGCEPSGALRRQLPPGLYSVAAENAAVGALAGKAEVILVTSARFSRVRLQGPSQELDVENCDTRQLGIGNVAAAAWGDPACKSGV